MSLRSIVKGSNLWSSDSVIVPFMLWSLRFLIWLQQILYDEMPTRFFFDLLRETDHEFVNRTGWYYRHDQLLYVPCSSVLVQPPHLPEGSRPCNPANSNVYPTPFEGPDEPWVQKPWSRRALSSQTLVQWTVDHHHLQMWTHTFGLMFPKEYVDLKKST